MVSKERQEQARNADLPAYLMRKGENLKHDGGGNYILKAPGLKVSVKSFRWNCQIGSIGGREGGCNAVDFVMGLYGLRFQDAVDELLGECTHILIQSSGSDSVLRDDVPVKAPKEVPKFSRDFSEAFRYLTNVRGINPKLVKRLIDEGYIKQTYGPISNLAFVCRDREGIVMGCEVRGMQGKRFFSPPPIMHPFHYLIDVQGVCAKGAYIFESAIDAISFWELYEGKTVGAVIASAHGIGNFSRTIAVVQEMYSLGNEKICMCGDSDDAGVDYMDRHPEYRRFQPAGVKDWNDVLKLRKRACIKSS
jgi:hypothetical protein